MVTFATVKLYSNCQILEIVFVKWVLTFLLISFKFGTPVPTILYLLLVNIVEQLKK